MLDASCERKENLAAQLLFFELGSSVASPPGRGWNPTKTCEKREPFLTNKAVLNRSMK